MYIFAALCWVCGTLVGAVVYHHVRQRMESPWIKAARKNIEGLQNMAQAYEETAASVTRQGNANYAEQCRRFAREIRQQSLDLAMAVTEALDTPESNEDGQEMVVH